MQWRNEITSHTDGMNVLVWHGASRITNLKELRKYDVVCIASSSPMRLDYRLYPIGSHNLRGTRELLPQAA